MLNSVVFCTVRCCNLWTRLRVSYAALFDPGLSGFIGNFTRQTFDVLRLLCELNLIVFAMMVSALKPVYVRRFCHKLQGNFFPTALIMLPTQRVDIIVGMN